MFIRMIIYMLFFFIFISYAWFKCFRDSSKIFIERLCYIMLIGYIVTVYVKFLNFMSNLLFSYQFVNYAPGGFSFFV